MGCNKPLIRFYVPHDREALIVFIANSQVNYLIGLVLGAGSMLGAWIATHVAIKHGTKFVRWFLLGAVLVFAVKLLVLVS